MTLHRLQVDAEALADALLPMVKEHCRVRHNRDDSLLNTYIAAAIGTVERKCNVSLNPAEYVATPDELARRGPTAKGAATWRLPLNNVEAVSIIDGADEDISDRFEVAAPDFGGNASCYLEAVDGASLPPDALLQITVGVDATTIAPDFALLIARIAASHYENREASAGLFADTFDVELSALWRPDV